MTASVAALLQPIKDRLNAANLGPLDISLSANRKWDLLLENPGTADERLIAKCVDDDEAALFMNAPTDQAKLIAALEAVESLASRTVNAPVEYSAGYLAKDILAALTSALESAA